MLDLTQYRDSVHGLLLPSAYTFALLGTNDYHIRKYRDTRLLSEGTDFVKFVVQNTPRIYYTLMGLQKLCQLLATPSAVQFHQHLQQLFPSQATPQLPAVGANPRPINFTLLQDAPLEAPLPAEANPYDPLAPAHLLMNVPQPANAPSSPPVHHPAVDWIAEGVTSRLEMVMAQQSLSPLPVPQKSEAEWVLEGQRLMMEAIATGQDMAFEGTERGAGIVQETTERQQDPLAMRLFSVALVCGFFVLAIIAAGVYSRLLAPRPQPAYPSSFQAVPPQNP